MQLLFALAFIALVCIFTYKVILPLCLKIIDLSLKSTRFRIGSCIFLAVGFCAVGVLQLKDFARETAPTVSWFFPLSFLTSGIFLFLGFRKKKLSK